MKYLRFLRLVCLRLFFQVTSIILSCFLSLSALAGCAFDGAGPSISPYVPLVFESTGYKLLGTRRWYDDSRYPIGSLMGVDSIQLKPRACADLGNDFSGKTISIVYQPPSNAERRGDNVFRIPSDAGGVSLELEFSSGVSHASGGVVLSQSKGTVVGSAISDVRAQFPSISVKVTLVKSGSFSSDNKSITFVNGLGTMHYYSGAVPSVEAPTITSIQMPAQYGDNYQAQAAAPSCKLNAIGDVSIGVKSTVIKMAAVNSNDFNGVGPIDKSSKAAKLKFSCSGTSETKPTVYFDATYPFKTGTEGVGMPKENSDIGVQLLFNDLPVIFRQRSAPLGWDQTPYNVVIDSTKGPLLPRGSYCINNCGTDMSGPNWADGGAIYQNTNDGFDSQITVKYYQTTSKTPAPQSFSVPFTVTLELQ